MQEAARSTLVLGQLQKKLSTIESSLKQVEYKQMGNYNVKGGELSDE